MDINETYYTVKEAATVLGVSVKTVHRYIKQGVLKAVMKNGRWAIPEESVEGLPRNLYGQNIDKIRTEFSVPSDKILMDKAVYEDLLKELGRLRAKEELLWEYKTAQEELEHKVKTLESRLEELERRRFWKKKGPKKKEERI